MFLSSNFGIGTILTLSWNFSKIFSFSSFNIEQVEYIISPPVLSKFIAFFNKASWVFVILSTNSKEKFSPNTPSVPLPEHGVSNKILSNLNM